jgi:ketosteroid isomerase-like protein
MIRGKKSGGKTMKARIAKGILVCALVFAARAAGAEDTGCKALDASWKKAVLSGDIDAIAAHYAEDAVLWLPNMPEARGGKAIREAYAELLKDYSVTDVVMSNTVYETWQNISFGWGNFAMTLQPRKGGAPVVMNGRFTDVARQIKGKWQYVADQASADPAPPAAAAPAAKP